MPPFDRCPWPQHLRWRSVNTSEKRIARVCGDKFHGSGRAGGCAAPQVPRAAGAGIIHLLRLFRYQPQRHPDQRRAGVTVRSQRLAQQQVREQRREEGLRRVYEVGIRRADLALAVALRVYRVSARDPPRPQYRPDRYAERAPVPEGCGFRAPPREQRGGDRREVPRHADAHFAHERRQLHRRRPAGAACCADARQPPAERHAQIRLRRRLRGGEPQGVRAGGVRAQPHHVHRVGQGREHHQGVPPGRVRPIEGVEQQRGGASGGGTTAAAAGETVGGQDAIVRAHDDDARERDDARRPRPCRHRVQRPREQRREERDHDGGELDQEC